MEHYAPPRDRHSTLEVVQPPPQSPPAQSGTYGQSADNEGYYKPPPNYSSGAPHAAADERSADPARRRRRRLMLLVGLGVLVVVGVVGGVVGGMLGSRKKSGGGGGGGSGGSTNTTSPPPSAMTGTVRAQITGYSYPTPALLSPSTVILLTLPTLNSAPYALTHTPPPTSGAAASTQNSTSTSLSLYGAVSFTPLALTSRSPGTLNLFVRGTDGAMWHKYLTPPSTNSWGPSPQTWEARGGYLNSPPTVVAQAADRLDIFATGGEDALYTMTWSAGGGWSTWGKLGGTWAVYAPTGVSWAKGRVDVFVVGGTDRRLYHSWLDSAEGSWQPQGTFEDLGGQVAGRPVAVSGGVGRLDVFARGGEGGLWHLAFADGKWAAWSRVPGVAVSTEPDAVAVSADRIEVFVQRDADQLYERRTFEAGKWGNPETLGGDAGGFSGPPKAVLDGGLVRVYGYDAQGRVVYRAFDWKKGSWVRDGWEVLGKPGGG